jgi:hypothetical protein
LSAGRDELHEPPSGSGSRATDGGSGQENQLEARLRRAWDWLSGRR